MSDINLQHQIFSAPYPQRDESGSDIIEALGEYIFSDLPERFLGRRIKLANILPLVNNLEKEISVISDNDLHDLSRELRYELRQKGIQTYIVAKSFALVREIARRQLGMRHYDTQILGGWAILKGMIAEMETGEGKTLTATLPACTAAMAGIPVHIITVNDYLARRDADLMRPIYEYFGLSVGISIGGMPEDQRRKAYCCDVVYSTNKQVAFDHLRDRLVLKHYSSKLCIKLTDISEQKNVPGKQLLLRGLCFGIIDEADSILVDEAVTPLIISRPGDTRHKREIFEKALMLASSMNTGADYIVEARDRNLELTEQGADHLRQACEKLDGLWRNIRYREELVLQALRAQRLFVRDKHYLVDDGKVKIVDEFTGRIMPDRTWEKGLHQMIEVKEGCEITGENETIGRISYQRFFRRYLKLGGMTGTAREVNNEMKSVYKLKVINIPPYRPLQRKALPCKIWRTQNEKWQSIVERIKQLYEKGQPVLVGTRSVLASEDLSERLYEAGIPHNVLNARQDEKEAEIIKQAGQKGQITVATNMAGRGTDIRLQENVAQLGGLHVIVTERHEAGRIDRQLCGRCGRQGDPGSHEAIISLEDELVMRYIPDYLRLPVNLIWETMPFIGKIVGRCLTSIAQKSAEKRHSYARRRLLRIEEYLENVLAFSGLQE